MYSSKQNKHSLLSQALFYYFWFYSHFLSFNLSNYFNTLVAKSRYYLFTLLILQMKYIKNITRDKQNIYSVLTITLTNISNTSSPYSFENCILINKNYSKSISRTEKNTLLWIMFKYLLNLISNFRLFKFIIKLVLHYINIIDKNKK